MASERQRDVGEVVARQPVLVDVATGQHRDLVDGAEQPERPRELRGAGDPSGHLRPRPGAAGGPLPRAPGDGDLALAGGHCHRGVADDAAAGAAAVADLAEPGDLAHAEVAGDVDLAAVLHRVQAEPVDLARGDAGVVQRHLDRAGGQLQLGVLETLAELGLADPDDRGPVLDAVFHGVPTSP